MAGGLLRERDPRLVISAVGISALGDFLALVPLALYLQGRTDSGVIVALLFVALWAPSVVLAGPAGGLVDRFETRRLLLLASLAQAGVVVALAFVHSTGSILALVVLLGSLFAVAAGRVRPDPGGRGGATARAGERIRRDGPLRGHDPRAGARRPRRRPQHHPRGSPDRRPDLPLRRRRSGCNPRQASARTDRTRG